MSGMVECVINVSAGRDPAKVRIIGSAIEAVSGAFLLDVSSDFDHNRSVFTFVGSPEPILEAAWRAVRMAVRLVDIRKHRGVHPRIGAVDVVPFVPLWRVPMVECVKLACSLGEWMGTQLEIPVYLYGEAARSPERRNLANIRRGEVEELRKTIGFDPLKKPDFGPSRVHLKAGASAVGARLVLVAYNVFLHSTNLDAARRIARLVRESSGGFPCVRALGLWIEKRGQVQISMNLTDYRVTSIETVFEKIRQESRKLGLEVASSQIVGLVPEKALPDRPVERLLLEDFDASRILENRIREISGQSL